MVVFAFGLGFIAFSLFLMWRVVRGVRTGRIGTSRTSYDRSETPQAYRFAVAATLSGVILFAALGALAIHLSPGSN